MKYIHRIFFLVPVLISACQSHKPTVASLPLTEAQQRLPENAVGGLKTAAGLQTTLFASEPAIMNPTNMDIDEKGRVWITEAYNYRNELNPGHPYKAAGDRIMILEDRDGDGKADTAKVFYQDTCINAALGICVLGNKVIVSCSPNVFVFTDTDGDDKADKKELLFRGIGGVQHDHAIHAFTFGPDGKLYFNFGNAGDSILDKNGNVIRDADGQLIANKGKPYRQGMIFRCDEDGSHLEVMAHNFRNNYEVAVDAFGNMWQSDNDDDGNRGVRINYILEHGNYGYTDEMTGASWQSRRMNMEDSIPYRHWHLNDPGVVPNLLQTGSGSPTGMVVYEGDLLPAVFHNQMIHGEPGHNVVRSYPAKKYGAGYTATIENILESATDRWFRPSDVCVAPDGSLFVADWYDPGVGGHQVGDLDRGRIFRIAPPGSSYKVKPPVLNTAADAVAALKSPNLSTRYLAWTKLRGMGASAEGALKEMYHDGNPRYQARALWLLSRLSNGADYVKKAFEDSNEDIRIAAIRAAGEMSLSSDTLYKAMYRTLVTDTSAAVRRQLLLTMYHRREKEMPLNWALLAAQYDGKDRWYLEALGIAADGNWDACFNEWRKLPANTQHPASDHDIIWRARTAAALPLLAALIQEPDQDPLQNKRYFRAFDFYPAAESTPVLLSLLQGTHPQQASINALTFLQLDANAVPQTPAMAALLHNSLLVFNGQMEFVDLVLKYHLRDQNDHLLQMVLDTKRDDLSGYAMKTLLECGGKPLVIKAMSKQDTAAAFTLVNAIGRAQDRTNRELLRSLMQNNVYALTLRQQATRNLGHGWDGYADLWNMVERKVLPADLDTVAQAVLTHAWRQDIKAKAVAHYQPANVRHDLAPVDKLVTLPGNISGGKKVFASYCATCHLAGNTGVNFGPALTEIGSKLTKSALYDAVITPDAGISFGFEGYFFKLKDGSTVLGYIASETKDEVDVRTAGGQGVKIQQKNISSRKPYEHSLMPTGLATAMPQQELVDLVTYLSSLKK
ncbi:PVC-type heme-binding CxxCH protein [Chitinophaga arvensicola]|uniref:Putative membrane-bound dehydrogenase domain-containing protein n=1 Tax=Chitinophaga arvensicola TaxID=29529 RepID=A0A1I0SC46_9BACT|nr:PVC-type heme-binding CxxCH protein [Chitinophaga arvensicola]SEW54279.1 putative membrane-bound dehydrogenase domain-containing protein [Chitinophaga arvensicola]